MPEWRGALSKWALAALLALGLAAVPARAADLSRYRGFELGSNLAAVAGRAGLDPSQAKVVYSRPALLQDLEWRPQALGSSSQAESAKNVIFSFHNGELHRIAVDYDRYELEGLTAEDIVAAVSASYGTAVRPSAPSRSAQDSYGEQVEILARWQDPLHRFDLVRLSYGPSYRLIGVLKRLEAPAEVAALEAARIDELEAPAREAERAAAEQRTERAKQEKARLANKPKFRP